MPKNVTLPYNGSALDRGHRTDPDWLDGRPVDLNGTGHEVVYPGAGDRPVFAADLSELDETAALRHADDAVDIRTLDAVRRELSEEAGVRADSVTYQASQAWPFPAGLMVGFRALATTEDIAVDEDELVDARWFTRAEVRALGDARPDSMETFLVDSWLAEAS